MSVSINSLNDMPRRFGAKKGDACPEEGSILNLDVDEMDDGDKGEADIGDIPKAEGSLFSVTRGRRQSACDKSYFDFTGSLSSNQQQTAQDQTISGGAGAGGAGGGGDGTVTVSVSSSARRKRGSFFYSWRERGSNRLSIDPCLLVGRDNEKKLLKQAYRRIRRLKHGSISEVEVYSEADKDEFPQLAIIHGFSGTGKTTLVHNTFGEERCFYLYGKYDAQQRNRPLTGITSAFSDLCEQIIASDEEERVATAIIDAVGEDADLITSLIPSMEDIFGENDDVQNKLLEESAGTVEFKNRLHFLFRRFVAAIASDSHPLVILLDDLQWADGDSLELIHALATENNNAATLFVLTYRDNEVGEDHPLLKTISDIQSKRGSNNMDIPLDNLSLEDVNYLVSTSLKAEQSYTLSLSQLIVSKTNGSPFWTVWFLRALYNEDILVYDFKKFQWTWDEAKIRSKFVTDNVSELMSQRLQKLPPEGQRVLQVAACLGCEFDGRMLELAMMTMALPEEEASKENLSLEDVLHLSIGDQLLCKVDASTFAFDHDQIESAAFDLIPAARREQFQRQVGRAIIANAEPDEIPLFLLTAIDLCNCGNTPETTEIDKNIELAALNLEAGKQAMKSASFKPAAAYCEAGIALLGKNPFDGEPTLGIDLHYLASQAHSCSGNTDCMYEHLDVILGREDFAIELKLPSYLQHLRALVSGHQYDDALAECLQVLEELGYSSFPEVSKLSNFDLSKDMTKTKLLLRKYKGRIAGLPLMDDNIRIHAMGVLNALYETCHQSKSPLLPFVGTRMVRWSLKYGLCTHSCVAFARFGTILCSMGNLGGGVEYAVVASELLERLKPEDTMARTMYVIEGLLKHWTSPIQMRIEPCLNVYEIGLRCGDVEGAMWGLFHAGCFSWYSSQRLDQLQKSLDSYCDSMREHQQEAIWASLTPFHQEVLNLMGHAPDPLVLSGDAMDLDSMLVKSIGSHHKFVSQLILSIRMEVSFLFHDYAGAAKMLDDLDDPEEVFPGSFIVCRQKLFEGLTCFQMARVTSGQERRKFIKRGGTVVVKMEKWKKAGSMNCAHMYYLLSAESAAAQKKHSQAKAFFAQAIATAQSNGFLQDKALAHERACLYFHGIDDKNLASENMFEAFYGYSSWGAHGLARHLSNSHPFDFYRDRLERQTASSSRTLTNTVRSSMAPSFTS